MMKRIVWLIFSGMVGIFLAPEILATADSLTVRAPKFSDPETVVVSTPAQTAAQVTAQVVAQTVAQAPVQAPVQVPAQTPTQALVARDNITILGRSLGISAAKSTSEDAGGAVKSYEKMLYGHNSGAVFGNLTAVNVGTTFTVTLGGTTKNYRVSEIALFEKISETALSVNGQKYTMRALAKNAKGHSLILLTCAGESYGNGDASHRLAVFADEI